MDRYSFTVTDFHHLPLADLPGAPWLNLIERFFNKLKQFRRVATRYDKLLVNFMGFVKLAAIAIWFR